MGSPFLWLLSFGEAKESDSAAGTNPRLLPWNKRNVRLEDKVNMPLEANVQIEGPVPLYLSMLSDGSCSPLALWESEPVGELWAHGSSRLSGTRTVVGTQFEAMKFV